MKPSWHSNVGQVSEKTETQETHGTSLPGNWVGRIYRSFLTDLSKKSFILHSQENHVIPV